MLFLYCFTIRKHSSQVQVLWEDHRNDLFINGFGALNNICPAFNLLTNSRVAYVCGWEQMGLV